VRISVSSRLASRWAVEMLPDETVILRLEQTYL
jgi:hypothetical protein